MCVSFTKITKCRTIKMYYKNNLLYDKKMYTLKLLNGPFAEFFFSKGFLNKSPKISLLLGNIK